MERYSNLIQCEDADSLLSQPRTSLVRLPRGVESTLFGGWGVRI